MESMVARYPALRRFLAAHFSVSGALGYGRTSWLEAPAPPLDFLRARFAATGSRTDYPNVPKISGPVDTRRAVREMLRAGSESLALVDGDGVAQGVLTARDVAMFCGHDPVGVVQGIRNASSEAELKPLLGLAARMVREGVAQPHDIEDCCLIGDEVLAALVDACLRLAETEARTMGIEPSAVPYCWVVFNSAARGDMPAWELSRLAAIYDDSGAGDAPSHRTYFNALAGAATRFLHAAGLSGHTIEWPEGVKPGMPVSEWKRFYTETIRNPLAYDLYARRDFFDLRLLGGEASILQQLAAHIESELAECAGTIALLAIDTMANVPPLTFFEGLAISIDGAKSDTFDIGQAVVAPLSNAARVFSLSRRRLAPVNTLARLETAIGDFPEGAEALHLAADAFRVGVYYQTLAGGPHIDCAMLGKFDQKLLKTTFASIERFLEFTVNTMVPV
jgi:signal-transduction protein with cAMP-binding, CBS, and nucleotidyltransferase domain